MNAGVTGFGAVLADAMGLGKTLQCIALIWALLKHGPYGNKPVLKRVIIVTPGTNLSMLNLSAQKEEKSQQRPTMRAASAPF